MPATNPTRLRLASYNLFKARFLDHPGPRGGTLREDFLRLPPLCEADVLLLQEAIVDPPGQDGPGLDTVGELASLLGWDASTEDGLLAGAPAPGGGEADALGRRSFLGAADRSGRRWGLGILSRFPAHFTSAWLPKPFWSPWRRGALFAEIGPWVVGTLHLEVWPIGAPARQAQMRAVLATLEGPLRGRDRPVVLAGDFNCERGGPHDELLRAGFLPALPRGEPTFAFAGLRLRLDHIYVRGARVEAASVVTAARGSDHWPVWAEVTG